MLGTRTAGSWCWRRCGNITRSGRYDSGLGSKSEYKTATTLQTQLVEARPPPHLLVEGESSLTGARSQAGGDSDVPVVVASRKVPPGKPTGYSSPSARLSVADRLRAVRAPRTPSRR